LAKQEIGANEENHMRRMNGELNFMVLTAMVVGASLLVGCATVTVPTRAYTGAELPESQVAKISAAGTTETDQGGLSRQAVGKIKIWALDGKPIEAPWWAGAPSEILVLPGRHVIRAGVKSTGPGGALEIMLVDNINKKWERPLEFNAEGGKAYTVCGEIIKKPEGHKLTFLESRGMWVYWIEETKSGKVMCGTHPVKSDTFADEGLMQHDYTPRSEDRGAH
jgi:hypothetical protein